MNADIILFLEFCKRKYGIALCWTPEVSPVSMDTLSNLIGRYEEEKEQTK